VVSLPFLLFAVILGGAPTSQSTECEWKSYPKPFYDQLDSELLRVRAAEKETEPPPQREFSHNGVYWLALEGRRTEVRLGLAGDRSLRIDVPDYSWRPLEARWVNDKLVYLGVTFNPHAGVYWVFDVVKEKAVLLEHWLEDVDGYLRCNPPH
jgi:hypothetical protein